MIEIPKEIEAIIFDCDGTIIDNMPLHLLSWQQAFEHFGESFTAEFLDKSSGMPLVETVEAFNKEFSCSLDPDAVAALKDERFEMLMHDAKPIREVCDLAIKYNGKLPMAVVSGSRRIWVNHSLKSTDMDKIFDVILTADDPFKGKPAPDLFLEAARILNVNPARCIVLEDGESGMIGARAAGMAVIDVCPIVDTQRELLKSK